MQEHLGSTMNLARINLPAFALHALCIVQTVSLHKIASAMPTGVERDSNLRRLHRFLAGYALNLDLIAKVIFALLPVKSGPVLTLDRTNWKFGETNIHILMPGVTHKGVEFPLLFSMLDKRGNSNWEERVRLIDRFIRLFGSIPPLMPVTQGFVQKSPMFILLLLINDICIFLKTTCGLVGDCHLDLGAEERIEITFTEFAFVFEATKFGYLGQ